MGRPLCITSKTCGNLHYYWIIRTSFRLGNRNYLTRIPQKAEDTHSSVNPAVSAKN